MCVFQNTLDHYNYIVHERQINKIKRLHYIDKKIK